MVFTFGIFSFKYIHHTLMTLGFHRHWKSIAKKKLVCWENKGRPRVRDCVNKKSELYFAWGRMSLRDSTGDVQNCTVKSSNWGHNGRGEKALNYVNIDKFGRRERIRKYLKSDMSRPLWMAGWRVRGRLAATSQTLRTIMTTALKKWSVFCPALSTTLSLDWATSSHPALWLLPHAIKFPRPNGSGS